MALLAVDIVLVPPLPVLETVIKLNHQLLDSFPSEYPRLNLSGPVPHLSLAMGGIVGDNLPKLQQVLETIAKRTSPLALTANATDGKVLSDGLVGQALTIDSVPPIVALHRAIMESTQDLLEYPVTPAMFFDEHIRAASVEFTSNFVHASAYEHFFPHITVGFGKTIPPIELPLTFTTTRLALYHLGNCNTARRLLFETELQKIQKSSN